jgi:hypothetical protein
MVTMQVLSQKVNKHPVTSIDLWYRATKTTASMKNPQTQLNRIIFITHTTFHDYNTL